MYRSFYDREWMYGTEDDGQRFKAMWKSIAHFQAGAAPLYPDGLLEMLMQHKGNSTSCN